MLYRCLANLCPRYSNMVLLFFFFKYEDSSCHCSRKADVTKLNAPKNSIGKTNILCSTRRLKLIMQRVVLSSFLLWKKTSRISGIKSISRGIQCSHHCFGLTCLQCGRVGRFSSGPRAEGAGGHVGSYVLNAAATPWRRGAGDQRKIKNVLSHFLSAPTSPIHCLCCFYIVGPNICCYSAVFNVFYIYIYISCYIVHYMYVEESVHVCDYPGFQSNILYFCIF